VEVKMETLTKYIEKTKIKIEIKEDIKSKIKELQDSIKDDNEEEQIKAGIYEMIKQFSEYKVELHSKDADIVVKDNGTEQIVAFFECKSVKNKDEMIEEDDINKKALHELIYYFLKAYKLNRDDIPTYLVVTNGKKWFVFNNTPFRDFAMDEKTLEECGISDRMLFKESSRSKIYGNIENYLGAHEEVLKNFKDNCFYFSSPEDIYRFLSPDILLNKYNPSTGSALNKEFYDELLYIFGLKEVELNGKKKIVPNGVPNTFYSQISEKVNDEEKILDLIIIWLNRILFLKLFEAKLVEFNDNKTFTFMDKSHIPNTTALKSLFFDVLAVPENQRGSKAAKFWYVPYLNSSLFEEKEIEKEFPISDIQGDDKIPYYSNTVLHTYKGKKFIRKQGETKLLDYLFEFLSAYRFEGQGDPSSLISPAVLGLIFEKINGYKDGSYYTPTEITDYMAKTAIEKAIFNKVKEQLRLDYDNFEEFKKAFFTFSEEDRKKIREIIRNLTILDPAVGSGHFLVSSLNVLLQIWYDLGIIDIQKKYEVKFENGDIKLYKNDKPFVYRKISSADDADFQQKVFKAKKEIIENNLFGVDINPKAVEIARLRLWIELLKNTYYNKPDGTMETLPNIDINIKVGDSLLAPAVNITASVLFGMEKINELNELFTKYQNEDNKEKRNEIKKEISESREKLRKQILTEIKYDELIWTIDFPRIFDEKGNFVGFDVVIGNPPYGIKFDEKRQETFKEMYREVTGANGLKGSMDSFALFIQRGLDLLRKNGVLTYIVPISITASDSMESLHNFLESHCETIYISSYAVRPKPIFENAVVNNSIITAIKTNTRCKNLFMTKLNRRSKDNTIENIISNLTFINALDVKLPGRYPKISYDIERKILNKIFSFRTTIGTMITKSGIPIYYRASGGRYFKVVTNYPTGSSAEKILPIDPKYANFVGAVLSSNLFFWFYQIYSDNLNLKLSDIERFPIPKENINNVILQQVDILYNEYLQDIKKNAIIHDDTNYKNINSFKEYKISKSKHLVDQIDDLIGPLYGLTPEEIEFIKKYDIEYRMEDD
jgi:hypothetical protein